LYRKERNTGNNLHRWRWWWRQCIWRRVLSLYRKHQYFWWI